MLSKIGRCEFFPCNTFIKPSLTDISERGNSQKLKKNHFRRATIFHFPFIKWSDRRRANGNRRRKKTIFGVIFFRCCRFFSVPPKTDNKKNWNHFSTDRHTVESISTQRKIVIETSIFERQTIALNMKMDCTFRFYSFSLRFSSPHSLTNRPLDSRRRCYCVCVIRSRNNFQLSKRRENVF